RSRPAEPLPYQRGPQGATVAQGGTVTQVTVSQGAPGTQAQIGQPPTADGGTPNPSLANLGAPALEVEELSRIEAGFNLDPVRVQQIGSFQQGQPQPTSVRPTQQSGLSQAQSQPQAQYQALVQQNAQDQSYLGPFG